MTGWELFAVTTVSLFFKHVLTVTVQATSRFRAKRFRHAEDAKLVKGEAGDTPLAERGQHLIRNSLENEPIFLALLFGYLAVNTDGSFQVLEPVIGTAVIYAAVFLGARVVHGLLMLGRVAGLRTLAYSVGLLATLGLCVQILMDVYG